MGVGGSQSYLSLTLSHTHPHDEMKNTELHPDIFCLIPKKKNRINNKKKNFIIQNIFKPLYFNRPVIAQILLMGCILI